MRAQTGLYIHIPFCRRICHYCDFAKTALYDQDLVRAYFEALRQNLSQLWPFYKDHAQVVSVYFGGGTPSLVLSEVMEFLGFCLTEYDISPREITLEANPEDLTPEMLAAAQAAGVNRLSLGVQSLDSEGLKFLTREHSPQQAIAAMQIAMQVFENVNVDLMFGWPGQSLRSWSHDLDQLQRYKVPHISLYNLTYEGATVMARRLKRGVLQQMPERRQVRYYHLAQELMKSYGYVQEEVSNFCLTGYGAVHNQLYWQDLPYIGLGAGAHGYLPASAQQPFGVRYAWPRQLRQYIDGVSAQGLTEAAGIAEKYCDPRDAQDWLLERVWTGLRTPSGLDLAVIAARTGLSFNPQGWLAASLEHGKLQLKSQVLHLAADEWVRESLWAQAICEAFS